MSINCQELFEEARNIFNGTGPTFSALFVRAVNRVTSDVNRQCGLDIDAITIPSSIIDVDDLKFRQAYSDGVSYYMQRTGEFSKKPDEKKERDYQRSLAMVQFHVLNDDDAIPVGYPERD